MHTRTLLVYGWYGRGNIGDELMKYALTQLFTAQGVNLNFVDKITAAELKTSHGVLFGGGSILAGAPEITNEALSALHAQVIPIFYVGVGNETSVHPIHAKLLDIAALVKYREIDMLDLAYSLQINESILTPRNEAQGILFIPNVETVPTHASPHWNHIAWEKFKDEIAQTLDYFVDQQVPVSFMLMCKNNTMEDTWACFELIARMRRRGWQKNVYTPTAEPATLCALLSKHRVVITQRYHGIILAEMSGVPYIAIEHHDKLKNVTPHRGHHISYYAFTKAQLIKSVEIALESLHIDPYCPPRNTYESIIKQIIELMR